MKHIIVGGDGFVGHRLAADLHVLGEEVLVADVQQSAHKVYDHVAFHAFDITEPDSVAALPIEPDDVVYNMAARMLSPILPRPQRRDFFWPVNTDGVAHLLDAMEQRGCNRLVHFTTDMVYGYSKMVPQTEEHPTEPLGPYGESKLVTEDMCRAYRAKGMRISVFRPRLIIGPGRLGILIKLFKLVDAGLPVPMIGGGRNPYQFISVYDCASAAVCAWRAGIPNGEYNIGSDDPPSVRVLLKRLIEEAESRSFVLPTPGASRQSRADAARLDEPAADGSGAVSHRRRVLCARLFKGQARAWLEAQASGRRYAACRLSRIQIEPGGPARRGRTDIDPKTSRISAAGVAENG